MQGPSQSLHPSSRAIISTHQTLFKHFILYELFIHTSMNGLGPFLWVVYRSAKHIHNGNECCFQRHYEIFSDETSLYCKCIFHRDMIELFRDVCSWSLFAAPITTVKWDFAGCINWTWRCTWGLPRTTLQWSVYERNGRVGGGRCWASISACVYILDWLYSPLPFSYFLLQKSKPHGSRPELFPRYD